jgi:uncharacterized delta-60 repeat protein
MQKKIKYVLAFFLTALVVSSPSYGQEWAITYYAGGSECGSSVQQTQDGGYVVAGDFNSPCPYIYSDFSVLKLDSNGDIVWHKTYGGSNTEWGNSVQETSDGGYIVAGKTKSFGGGSYDYWVLKLNSDGNIVWQKAYGGSGWDSAESVRQTSDGGYVVAGLTGSYGAGSYDYWVLKLNSDGNIIWQKTYGGSGGDSAGSVRQTSDGGYVVTGTTVSFGEGSVDYWVLKLNSDGDIVWQKTYGGSGGDSAESVRQTSDGGYIVAGYSASFGDGSYDFWVLKLNSNGGVVWEKSYGGIENDYSDSLCETPGGGYFVTGTTSSFGAGSRDFWVLKLDSGGDVVREKTYGGTERDGSNSVGATSDGGYVLAGTTSSFGEPDTNLWVLKLNANGEIPGCRAMGESSAVVTNTSAVIADTSVTPSDTSVMPLDTTGSANVESLQTSLVCWADIAVHKADFDDDGDVDGTDLQILTGEFGSTGCGGGCICDIDNDDDVDIDDLLLFAQDFGKGGL